MNIQYSKAAVKAIKVMDKPTKQRIKKGIEGLVKTPPEGDIKPMQGYSDNVYRLRIGKYRIIYKITVDTNGDLVYIIDIGSRGDIYK